MHYNDPSREDQFDFLIRCYFGSGTDYLRLCVHRAYLDLNRTLHGFAKLINADDLREKGYCLVVEEMKLLSTKGIISQKNFDDWHESACEKLKKSYITGGFDKFSIGQSQKWINMSLKYIFSLGEDRISGFKHLYKFSHIPIDNVFLKKVITYGFKGINVPWSRLDNYQDYLNYQQQFRKIFVGSSPLAAEFQLWLKE